MERERERERERLRQQVQEIKRARVGRGADDVPMDHENTGKARLIVYK